MLSVICPVYNEEKYMARCLDSIREQDYPHDDLEVLFVDGMSTDRTREIIRSYQAQCPYVRIIDNPQRYVPWAMNRGIDASRGEVIIRIDAHTIYEPNYFSALIRRLYELDATVVGTVCRTDVLHKTPKTLAIREVLCNRFGVGNSVFRTGVDDVREVDTVPFGCWKRETFDRFGRYDTRLIRNQDIEFNKRILRNGGRIFIIPDTFCTYYARETFSALAANNFANGKWNLLTIWITGTLRALSPRHFVPLAFVLSLLIPLIIGIFWRPALWIALASLLAYLLLLGVISAKLAREKQLSFVRLLQSFCVLHLSYGCGSLIGLLSLPFVKK